MSQIFIQTPNHAIKCDIPITSPVGPSNIMLTFSALALDSIVEGCIVGFTSGNFSTIDATAVAVGNRPVISNCITELGSTGVSPFGFTTGNACSVGNRNF